MKRFHRNLNIMSIATAGILVLALIFWRTVLNIAITNILLNGIIIGTTIFGIGLCFANMFKLLPEYKWMHAYFEGRTGSGFAPKLLRPVSMALHNKHIHITTTSLSELLDMVMTRIEDDRDWIRYVTNTLIFLGLLGTFWGLILTVGGFADLLVNLDFSNEYVLQEMQLGMAGPLSGMATAFTSSLLGLAGSLIVGFLGLQLQFAQNTMFTELTDFMTQYVLQKPGTPESEEIVKNAPVNESTYKKLSEIYDAFVNSGYEICDLVRLDGKSPAIVAVGTDEKLFVATLNNDYDTLQNVLKRIELCFADTLENVKIDAKILYVSGKNADIDKNAIRFASVSALTRYVANNKNIRPKTKEEKEVFDAFVEYIKTAMQYLFKSGK